MNRLTRTIVVAFLACLIAAIALPATATEAPPQDGQTDTTVAVVPVSAGETPAVVIPAVSVEAEEQPWTARFTYPLFGGLAVLLIGGLAIGYNRSIRSRYRVVG